MMNVHLKTQQIVPNKLSYSIEEAAGHVGVFLSFFAASR